MRQFIDVTGKTEEEAINRALEQLKLDRDDVSVEILERAKAGFLGLGSCPAKVRVSYGEDEEPAAPAQPKAEKVREDKLKAEKPRTEKKPAEKPQRREEPVKKELAPKTEEAQTVKSPEDLGEEVNDERAQEIRKFLSGLLQQMEVQAEVKVYLPERAAIRCSWKVRALAPSSAAGARLWTPSSSSPATPSTAPAAGSVSSWTPRITGPSGNRAWSVWPTRWRARWSSIAAALPWSL